MGRPSRQVTQAFSDCVAVAWAFEGKDEVDAVRIRQSCQVRGWQRSLTSETLRLAVASPRP
jgi:hypothetical protein